MDRTENNPTGADQARDTAERQPAAPIDVRQLADRVYRLMQADLRLARVRGERTSRHEKR